ncbi:MAG: helix-turn-helix domain-containing protein [Candidatus Sericytochromatia bacterium]|nr:helix-turn-helix domain-containing protein [Candidatus Tanganyikabacteria bacterium]
MSRRARASSYERLRVSATTLSIWRCTGRQKLPYVKRGRSVLYRESDVAAFISAMPTMTAAAN